MMIMTLQPKLMRPFTLPRGLLVPGWSTAAMTLPVAALLAIWPTREPWRNKAR